MTFTRELAHRVNLFPRYVIRRARKLNEVLWKLDLFKTNNEKIQKPLPKRKKSDIIVVYLIFPFFGREEVIMEKIVLQWDVQAVEDTARVTAMYCFKNCNVNEN